VIRPLGGAVAWIKALPACACRDGTSKQASRSSPPRNRDASVLGARWWHSGTPHDMDSLLGGCIPLCVSWQPPNLASMQLSSVEACSQHCRALCQEVVYLKSVVGQLADIALEQQRALNSTTATTAPRRTWTAAPAIAHVDVEPAPPSPSTASRAPTPPPATATATPATATATATTVVERRLALAEGEIGALRRSRERDSALIAALQTALAAATAAAATPITKTVLRGTELPLHAPPAPPRDHPPTSALDLRPGRGGQLHAPTHARDPRSAGGADEDESGWYTYEQSTGLQQVTHESTEGAEVFHAVPDATSL